MIPAALLALTSTVTLTSTPALTSTDTEIILEEEPPSEISLEEEQPALPPARLLRFRANVRFDAHTSIDTHFDSFEQVATFGLGGRLELEVDVAEWLTAFAAPMLFFQVAIDADGGDRAALFINTPEGFVRASVGPIDLRAGALVFNWGTSDLIAPNDVLNPIDYRRNIVASADDTKIPVVSAELVVSAAPLTLRAVVEPFFTPPRYFLVGWDSSLIPLPIAERLGLAGAELDELADLIAADRPSYSPKNATGAARAELRVGDVDLALNGVYGWDPTPLLSLETLTGGYQRRKLLGFEATLLIDPVILKLDAAYTFRRTLYSQALAPVRKPWLNTVLGAEYAYGDDLRIVLELFMITIFDVEDRLLLFEPIEPDGTTAERTVFLPGAAAFIRYAVLSGDLRFELGALTTPTRGDVVLLPAIRWRFFDQHDLSVGASIIQGRDDSYGGAYDHNDEIFLHYQWER